MNFGEMADAARDAATELDRLRTGRPSGTTSVRALAARLASLDFGGDSPASRLVRDAIGEAGGEAPADVDGLAPWVEGLCCWLDAIGDGGTMEKEESARLRAICVALSELATVRAARGYVRRKRLKEST